MSEFVSEFVWSADVGSLFRAVDLKKVEVLIEAGADIDAQDEMGRTALMYDANELNILEKLHLPKVRELIKLGANVNAQDQSGTTALMYAARRGNVKMVLALLKGGAFIDTADTSGKTALAYAEQACSTERAAAVLKYTQDLIAAAKKGKGAVRLDNLLLCGAFIHAKYDGGKTALTDATGDAKNVLGHTLNLIEAVKLKNTLQVQRLLRDGASANGQNKRGSSVLICAANLGCLEIVRALINAGANTAAEDKDGVTALIWAVHRGHLEIVEELIKAGTKVNAQDQSGRTALMKAARGGHLEIVQALIKAGAPIDAKDKNEKTAWRFASKSKSPAIYRLLKNTASLLRAVRARNPGKVEQLINNGVDLNFSSTRGTLLLEALRVGSSLLCEIVKSQTTTAHTRAKKQLTILILSSFKLTPLEGGGPSPISLCYSSTSIWKVIKAYLTSPLKHINLDADYFGNTALMWAAQHGKVYEVKRLLFYKASPNRRNASGHTALNLASEHSLDCSKNKMQHTSAIKCMLEKAMEQQRRGSVSCASKLPNC